MTATTTTNLRLKIYKIIFVRPSPKKPHHRIALVRPSVCSSVLSVLSGLLTQKIEYHRLLQFALRKYRWSVDVRMPHARRSHAVSAIGAIYLLFCWCDNTLARRMLLITNDCYYYLKALSSSTAVRRAPRLWRLSANATELIETNLRTILADNRPLLFRFSGRKKPHMSFYCSHSAQSIFHISVIALFSYITRQFNITTDYYYYYYYY